MLDMDAKLRKIFFIILQNIYIQISRISIKICEECNFERFIFALYKIFFFWFLVYNFFSFYKYFVFINSLVKSYVISFDNSKNKNIVFLYKYFWISFKLSISPKKCAQFSAKILRNFFFLREICVFSRKKLRKILRTIFYKEYCILF